MTSNILGSSICSSKSLYKKTSQEILAELKAGFKTGASKVQETNPSYPACYDPTVRSVSTAGYHRRLPSPPRRRERKNITKRTFRATTIIVQMNKKRLLFFFLKFWVWVFLFLQTPFFKTQHFGPMVHSFINILSAGAVQYTDCPTNDCSWYTLNNLMVRFQWCQGFGEYGAPLQCHCSQVHSGTAW